LTWTDGDKSKRVCALDWKNGESKYGWHVPKKATGVFTYDGMTIKWQLANEDKKYE
jgi:hypothetical protein